MTKPDEDEDEDEETICIHCKRENREHTVNGNCIQNPEADIFDRKLTGTQFEAGE